MHHEITFSEFTFTEGSFLAEILTDETEIGQMFTLVKNMKANHYNIEVTDHNGYSHTL